MVMLELIKKKGLEKTKKEEPSKEETEVLVRLKPNFKPLFLFVSDTHINAHQYNLKQRARDTMESFKQVVEIGKNVMGDELVIVHGGDFFNSPDVKPSTILEASESIGCVPTYIIRGNHDGSPLKARDKDIALSLLCALRSNIRYDEEDRTVLDYMDGDKLYLLNIIFQSYLGSDTLKNLQSRNIEAKQRNKGERIFNILVVHGIVEGVSPFGVTIPREEFKTYLRENNIDLVLTGHLHTKFEDEELKLLNPGSLECLDIDQANANRGFYFVGMNGDKLDYQWIEIKTRKFFDITIELGDISQKDANALASQIISSKTFPKGSIIRFTIKGTSENSVPRVDKSVFTRKFPDSLKILVVNKIKRTKDEEVQQEIVSIEDALIMGLKEAGAREGSVRHLSGEMMEVAKDIRDKTEGWRDEVKKCIRRSI